MSDVILKITLRILYTYVRIAKRKLNFKILKEVFLCCKGGAQRGEGVEGTIVCLKKVNIKKNYYFYYRDAP